jgi:hypothetical protein
MLTCSCLSLKPNVSGGSRSIFATPNHLELIMKKTLLTIAATLAVSAVSLAQAAPQTVADPSGGSVQINASSRYYVAPNEFRDYQNSYQLANGQVITFSQRNAHYFTQIDNGDKVEMHATAPGVFFTSAGTRIRFTDSGDTVAIADFDRLPLAANAAPGTMMMASR